METVKPKQAFQWSPNYHSGVFDVVDRVDGVMVKMESGIECLISELLNNSTRVYIYGDDPMLDNISAPIELGEYSQIALPENLVMQIPDTGKTIAILEDIKEVSILDTIILKQKKTDSIHFEISLQVPKVNTYAMLLNMYDEDEVMKAIVKNVIDFIKDSASNNEFNEKITSQLENYYKNANV